MEIEALPCKTPWLRGSQRYRLFVSLSRPTLLDLMKTCTPAERKLVHSLRLKAERWHTGRQWLVTPGHVASLRLASDMLRRLMVEDSLRADPFPRLDSLLSHEATRRDESTFGRPCMVHVDLDIEQLQGVLRRRGWQKLTDYAVQLIMFESAVSGRHPDSSDSERHLPEVSKKKHVRDESSADILNKEKILFDIYYGFATPYRKGTTLGVEMCSARWMGPTEGWAYTIFPDLWITSIFMARGCYWVRPMSWHERWMERYELEDPLPARRLSGGSFDDPGRRSRRWRRSVAVRKYDRRLGTFDPGR